MWFHEMNWQLMLFYHFRYVHVRQHHLHLPYHDGHNALIKTLFSVGSTFNALDASVGGPGYSTTKCVQLVFYVRLSQFIEDHKDCRHIGCKNMTYSSLVEWLRQTPHDLKVPGSIPHKEYNSCRNHMLNGCSRTTS